MTDQDQSREAFYAWLRTYEEEVGALDDPSAKAGFTAGWQAALNHKADATPTTEESSGVVLPEPFAWADEGKTRNGSHGTDFRVVTAAAKANMPRAASEAYTVKLFTEQAVRTLLAKGIKESLTTAPAVPQRCWCETCDTAANVLRTRMALCPTCGNKRCPRANHHGNVCTGSNAPGQPGSSWEHVKPAPSPPPQEQT